MRKILILFACLLSANILSANIYIPSAPSINELAFDENGDWQLEILYQHVDVEGYKIDSVVISTINYRYKINLPVLEDYQFGFLVLNQDTVGDSLNINQEGDSIRIETFTEIENMYNFEVSILTFGNYNKSLIAKPNLGESIARYEGYGWFYTISSNPSIGAENPAIGALGWIKGNVYDDDKLLQQGFWFTFDFSFYCNNGNYITKLKPGNRSYSRICDENYTFGKSWLDIKPFNVDILVNDTVEVDIFITDPAFVDISEEKAKSNFSIYPNPATNRIIIESTEFSNYQTIQIQLIDVKGQEVANYSKTVENLIVIELDSKIKAGIYLLNILGENKLIYSEKIIINSFK